jgi:hypothetical protein
MPNLLPRLRRKVDRNNWVPIGEDGRLNTMARHGSVTTSATLSGPPNFAEPVETQFSPPPTYAQVRDISRPEIANLMVRQGGQRRSVTAPSLATSRQAVAPTARINNLEDIQHNERRVPMDNRLSSVPNYPVFLDIPDLNRSRRRSSIASTNTAGILLSVGSLPGSEPFDESPAAWNTMNGRCTALDSHPPMSPSPLSPLISPLTPFEASVAHVMTVHRVCALPYDLDLVPEV